MLIKYTLKNIFQKPFRLIVLIVCMSAACFSGFLAVDFGGSMKTVMLKLMAEDSGDAKYRVTTRDSKGVTDDLFAGYGDTRSVGLVTLKHREDSHTEEEYRYVITEETDIMAFSDYNQAVSMRLCPADMVPKDREIVISNSYSRKFHKNEGDTITLSDADNNPVELTVSHIMPNTGIYAFGYPALVSTAQMIELKGKESYPSVYLDLDSKYYKAFESDLDKNHPEVSAVPLYADESTLTLLQNVSNVMYLIFVLVFVLVIFVTVSFTEKILTERMSVIGTLRSIGISRWKTTCILLFENVMYALISSVLALTLYITIRSIFIRVFMSRINMSAESIRMNIPMFLLVIAGAILVQMMVPLASVLKASKTSIRDIIFETRDAEYRISMVQTIIGGACLVLGLILGFVFKNMLLSILGVLLIIVGGTLMVCFMIRKLTELLSRVFGKSSMPVAELASYESGSKKPNASNAMLTVAAVTAASAIFVIGSSVIYSTKSPSYQTDLIITGASEKTAAYDYLKDYPEVKELEFILLTKESTTIEDKLYGGLNVLSLPTTGQYLRFGPMPESLDESEVVLSEIIAEEKGIHVGDRIVVEFHSMGVFPVEKELTVKAIAKKTPFLEKPVLVLSPGLYKSLFPDYVSEICIRTDNPAELKSAIEKNFYSSEVIQTMQQKTAEDAKSMRTIRIALIVIISAALVLTLIGISGNQVIGFAARKKEYAMLHSCACSRSKIVRMILTENAILFGLSVLLSAILTVPVSLQIAKIFRMSGVGINISVRYDTLIICIVVLWLAIMLTALSPIRELKKMNTAMELKYE